MNIKFLIATICYLMVFKNLHAQEKKVESTLVIHTKNEKSSEANAPAKPFINQSSNDIKTDNRKSDSDSLTQHTKNEESVEIKAIRPETNVTPSPVVKITPENKEEILSKVKLTEHTKNEESSETTRPKKN